MKKAERGRHLETMVVVSFYRVGWYEGKLVRFPGLVSVVW